jgi:hypothetical protein
MKLSTRALEIIGDTDSREAKATRTKIALALNCTERWVLKCIQENKDNGPLTKIAAFEVIRQDTKLSDSQLLEADAAINAA